MVKEVVEKVTIIFSKDANGVYSSYMDGGGSLPARSMEQLCIGVLNATEKLNDK